MYSVLIQNQKTIELFQEFHSLFMESMNNGQIGVCRWMEPGTTVDTALPELRKMIEDKEEWRAIIVRVVDEEDMLHYECDSQNPFDFTYFHQENLKYQENPVPLVRVTNMLGGMPAPDIKYEAKTVCEENKSPRIVYVPTKSDEDNRIYNELVEKYDYDGKAPSEIVLISVRAAQKEKKESIEKVWINYKEIESSNFWKKNGYSTQCRFVTYDIKKQGNVQYIADMFKFWTAVLMLAKNKIDTDELQAYRLYKVDVDINRNLLGETIQKTVNRMQGAKHYMQQMIYSENNKEMVKERKLPNYRMEVPVSFDIPGHRAMNIEPGKFPLIARDVGSDLKQWNEVKRMAEFKLRGVVDKAEIALDESAERMRVLCSMEDSEVLKIDKYQNRMMNSDLKNLFRLMQNIQTELPDSDVIVSEGTRKHAEEVHKSILERITSGQIKGIIGIMLLLIFLSVIPGLLVFTLQNVGDKKSLISFFLLLLDVFVIPITVMVISQKRSIKEMIDKYNLALYQSIRKIGENAGLYSEFLSSIVSHSRGKSYLHILKNKTFSVSNKHRTIEKHMRAVESMLDTLEIWSKAFYLDVSLNPGYYEDNEFDIKINPAQNRVYTLEYGNEYQVPLNKSGDKLNVGYEFVTKMELIREELYD